ncbi:MAG: GatB/YqeY domain-containing protein [Chloroflexi bacterium]|nr:MAG: GatB/YqeY domain-containing protein [Chloroflexota bacterium]
MALREQLQTDLHDAIRARDERRKGALRMVLADIQRAEVKNGPLSDDKVLALIQKEVKRRQDALEMIRKAGRKEMAAIEATEIEILRAYLPEPLSRAAITELVQAVILEVGASSPADMGKVMPVLMPQVRGKADGRLVSGIVRDLLSA